MSLLASLWENKEFAYLSFQTFSCFQVFQILVISIGKFERMDVSYQHPGDTEGSPGCVCWLRVTEDLRLKPCEQP